MGSLPMWRGGSAPATPSAGSHRLRTPHRAPRRLVLSSMHAAKRARPPAGAQLADEGISPSGDPPAQSYCSIPRSRRRRSAPHARCRGPPMPSVHPVAARVPSRHRRFVPRTASRHSLPHQLGHCLAISEWRSEATEAPATGGDEPQVVVRFRFQSARFTRKTVEIVRSSGAWWIRPAGRIGRTQ